MESERNTSFNSGSRWNRWDPHIHAPGTILNDQFKGDWKSYIAALEALFPTVGAIGVTDYYSVETYERLTEEKKAGRLPNCALIFPNVEMRLGIGTVRGKWANVHLLVSPDDPNHVAELKRILGRLTFSAHGDTYACTKDDLIRLGKHFDPSIKDPTVALERGSEQFKVSFEQLKQVYDNDWAKENILVAVAGGADGTSGIKEPADAALRREVEKFAHIIFASSSAQREFWLGQRDLDESQICERYGGLKPCLHGSDAHDEAAVGAPDGSRYSWLKGDLHFDTLRQAAIDPAGRAYVGAQPPIRSTPSQVIAAIEFQDADWAKTPRIELNPGLVAIIGARGSGKTALADSIALGCDATSERLSEASFLTRARDLLHGSTVRLAWLDGEEDERSLDGSDDETSAEYPRARYLSQQFVEELCSAQGMTDALMREIERVIFEAHAMADRDGAVDFNELLQMRASRFREARSREEETLAELSERIGIELEKHTLIAGFAKQVAEKERTVASYTSDRAKLVSKGSEVRLARLTALTAAAEQVRANIRHFVTREQAVLSLTDEVGNFRNHQAPEALRRSQERYRAANLKPEDWKFFLLDYKGDVDSSLRTHLASAQGSVRSWKGTPVALGDPNTPLIGDADELNRMPLSLLEAEIARIEKLVGADRETAAKFGVLSKRLVEESAALERLKQKLTDCQGAMERVKGLVRDREAAYVRTFEAVLAEQNVLVELYSPLMDRLKAAGGTLTKLSFSVARDADVVAWGRDGEELLDLRKLGTFKGRGTLRQLAETTLKEAWEAGDPQSISAAMAKFRADNQEALLDQAPVPKSQQSDYREWAKRFAKWLYGTEHVRIQYSIDYDGVDIRKLSPGTRGIVLLLLYLALDDADDRPLIIDQPEENLDPKSIFDELVGLFLIAKAKRQVIMVTHNANLVVNTDADQIIVAQAGPHPPGRLPPMSYLSGGLENESIRRAVCDILEGGEIAFRERARRLRVKLER